MKLSGSDHFLFLLKWYNYTLNLRACDQQEVDLKYTGGYQRERISIYIFLNALKTQGDLTNL